MSETTEKAAVEVEAADGKTDRAQPRGDARGKTRAQPKRQPPYAVVLHNDPINGFGYVIGVLRKVFRCGGGKCFWLTLKAHTAGRSIVWSGSLEVAELKCEQVRGCGPDPEKVKDGARPLKVTAEPLPG